MHAFSAARRYSCGLANLFVPPSSSGSSMRSVKSLATAWPLIMQPDTWVSDRAPPRHSDVTAQCVAALHVSQATPSMQPRRPSVSTPLSTAEVDVFKVFILDFINVSLVY